MMVVMGNRRHRSGRSGTEQHRRESNTRQSQDLHRSVFAHLTRRMADPDQPGQQISYGELELRLRGRAYRQALWAARPDSRH